MATEIRPPMARVITIVIKKLVAIIKTFINVVNIKIRDLPLTTERIPSSKYTFFSKSLAYLSYLKYGKAIS